VVDDVAGVDVSAAHWRALIGGQSNFTMTDKYRGKRLVKGGIPVIFLCNPDMNFYEKANALEKLFLDVNLDIVHIESPLFKSI